MWEEWRNRMSSSERTFWCSVKTVSVWVREREGRERKSGEEIWESDGDRWEGESGSRSDPADQMLINWVHCQLWVSSVTVTLLHFTLFFSCSSSSYFSPFTSSASSFPPPFSLFVLLTSTRHYHLSLHMLSHSFRSPVKKNPKPFTFLLFFKHTALHWMSHSRSHYFQERRCLLFFLHVGAKRCFVSRGAQICFLMFHWNMPWVVTLGHVCRERTIHFQYKACFANRLQMMFGVLAHCWLYMLIHADWWVLRANQVGMSTTFSSFL